MKRILLSSFCAGACLAALAIPAPPMPIKFTQPDGTVIELRVVGDEFGHVAYSSDGRLVVNVGGCIEYARFDKSGFPMPSGIAVGMQPIDESVVSQLQNATQVKVWTEMVETNKREKLLSSEIFKSRNVTGVEGSGSDGDSDNDSGDNSEGDDSGDDDRLVPFQYGRVSSSFPVLGEQKGLVVLVEYEDVSFEYGDFDYFNRMLNEEGFSDFGSLGSARDWFVYNSNGAFLPDFDVYGPVVLPHKREYYGKNDAYDNDMYAYKMPIHALEILDDEVDFSQYDRDGDGKIDNVFIFYAGKGEHDSRISNAVWPHSWDVTLGDTQKKHIFDGVQLDHYACSCEYPNGYDRPDGIGTFVHEFSHVIGLPDLYVTTYSGGFTPGEWSVLDVGPYNNDRLTPPNYSSFEKCALGWVDMIPLKEGIIEIPNFAETNVAYALPTERPDEFFFFENRQQIGNDAFIPGHGMLVWHIDYLKSVWESNTVNNNSSHQRVDIIEADNIKTERTRSGDAFPGDKNVTSLGFKTRPQLASWKRKQLQFDLENIEETDDGLIRFDAVATDNGGAVETLDAVSGDNGVCYDLFGRKISNPSKGIYVVNGKKVLVK